MMELNFMSTDKFLEPFDSYLIRYNHSFDNTQVKSISIILISNKWWKFNKTLTFATTINYEDATFSLHKDGLLFINRCKNHFGY